jgi:hypothetical protein
MRLVVIPILLASSVAAAEPEAIHASAPEPTYDVGFRIGGYGFHREGDTSARSWTECRMNGFGVFVDRALRGPLYVEGGLDAYASQGFPIPASSASNDLPIDRQSILASTAIGVRGQLAPWLRAYVQLGAGVELTRVAIHYGDGGDTVRDQKAMPEGFFGFGADLRIARGTYLGATLRMLVMGNFNYDPAMLKSNQWVASPDAKTVFDASPDLASQAQFYLRRDL